MILSIDFGSAVAKVLVAHLNGDYRLIEYPLGFKTRPHWTLVEALRFIISDSLRQVGGGKPEAIYASGEIASVALKELLSAPPLNPTAVYNELHLPVVDLGHAITYVMGKTFRGDVPAADICRFLPRKITELEVENYLGNKKLYPQLVPLGPREHAIEQAVAIAAASDAEQRRHGLPALKVARNSGSGTTEIALTGAVFAKAPSFGEALLIVLDALSLPPVTEVFLDTKLVIPALATLSFFEKDLAEKIFLKEPLLALGSVFSLPEELNLKLDLGLGEPLALLVAQNRLTCVPLGKGKIARVEFDSPSQKGSFEVRGGELGLVIDTRPKPLQMPSSRRERWKMIEGWKEALCRPALE
jgi:hypothetical protein